jgi:hypothetical protein
MFFASTSQRKLVHNYVKHKFEKHGKVGEEEHNIHLTKGVSHCDLAICIKKYLKAKEEITETQNISPCKKI